MKGGGGEGGGSQIDPSPEKATLKKPSLIWVNSSFSNMPWKNFYKDLVDQMTSS